MKNLNSETKTDNISKMNRNITPKNNSETLTSTTKSTHANQCTQTPLKLSKKSMFSATNKSNVETQTLNQLWNHLSVDKNKIKQKNTSMQSSANKKSQTNHSKLSLKIIKNQKKNKVDKNVNTCSISRRVKNCKQNGNKKISPKTNHCNVSSNTFTNTDDLSENIPSDDNDRFKTCNEDTLEDNSVIDEHSNVFLSNSVLKPISNSSSMDFNCQFDCEDIATQSSNIETQTALDELLYSNPPKCGDMQDDIFSELIRLSDTQTQTTWPLNCELKENTKVEADPKDIVTNFSDIKTQTAFDKLLYSNTSKCDDMQDDIFSELIHLSDIQTQTTWPPNCEDNSKVEIDSKDTGTQFSDIETQTALDELLYSNTPKCDDMQDDIFSKLIHLSDIQTQTTWPLNRDWKEISEVEIDSKDSTILKSTETQTIDTKSYKNPLFLTCNYNMDKNSPLFESTSHFCFKETQTSSCYLDSSKRKSLNSKNIARLELLDNSLNSNCNSNDFSTKSILPSAETQTQFSFDDNQFLNRKSDVLLSYCTTETQTCFEDDYLEDV